MATLIGGVRFDELPIVHIKSSPNNTIIHITDYTGMYSILYHDVVHITDYSGMFQLHTTYALTDNVRQSSSLTSFKRQINLFNFSKYLKGNANDIN